MLIRFLIALISACVADSFKWRLTDTIPGNEILTFSERYMFSSNRGPTFLPNHAAYIEVTGKVQ